MEEGRICRDDSECSKKQYCYEVSRRCVDYTICNRYNREEGQNYARHASQCGPCFLGYTAEVLGSGEIEELCKKVSVPQQHNSDVPKFNSTIIYIAVVGILLLIAALFIFVKKQYWRRLLLAKSSQCDNRVEKYNEVYRYVPTAPMPENSPFMLHSEHVDSVPINNNQNVKDKNTLLTANAFNNPYWARTDPSYEPNLSNDELNATDQSDFVVSGLEPANPTPNLSLISANLPEDDTNPSSWTPEQLTAEVPSRPFAEFAREHRDNATNIVLQRSSMGEGCNDEPTPEASNTQGNRDHSRTSNVIITMNLNVVNGDC